MPEKRNTIMRVLTRKDGTAVSNYFSYALGETEMCDAWGIVAIVFRIIAKPAKLHLASASRSRTWRRTLRSH